MYAVVEFCNTLEVEVVPCLWLIESNTYCLWPPYKSSTRQKGAVIQKESPSDTWAKYRIKVLKQTATYETARKKLQKVTIRSDLNTTDDEVKKREPKPISRLGSSSEEEDDKLPVKKKKVSPLPNPQVFRLATVSDCSSNSGSQIRADSKEKDGGSTSKAKISHTTENVKVKASTSLAPTEMPQPSTSSTDQRASLSSQPEESRASTSSQCLPAADRDRMLFRCLEEIKGQVRQNTLLLQALVKRQQPSDVAMTAVDQFKFPMRTKDDVQRVETLLCDKTTEKALISHLSSLGGTSDEEVVRRIMSHVMTNKLAMEYNWVGRGKKSAFSVLSLAKAIKGAAKKLSVTEAQTEAKIKTWLKYSADRDGGRKKRGKKEKSPGAKDASTNRERTTDNTSSESENE